MARKRKQKTATPKALNFLDLVNKRFVNKDGSLVSLKTVLRDYVEAEDRFEEGKGSYSKAHDFIEETAKEIHKKNQSEEDIGEKIGDKEFYDVFLSMVKKASPEKYKEIRWIMIKNREIEATDNDARVLEQETSNGRYGDFWKVAKAFDFDNRAIADALRILYPNIVIDSDAAYHISAKLVTGRVRFERREKNPDPLADLKELIRSFEPDLFLKEKTLKELCMKEAENKYLFKFIEDSSRVFAELRKEIECEECEPVRKVLQHLLDFYTDIDSLRIKGSVGALTDRVSGEVLRFPSVHQKFSIKKILKDKRVLIADEMGVGKTAQALLAFVELCNREPDRNHKCIIICPSGLLEHWEKEISNYLEPEDAEKYKPTVIRSKNKDEAMQEAQNAKVVMISYDMIIRSFNGQGDAEMRRLSSDSDAMGFSPAEALAIVDGLASMGFSYAILDEVHRAKNPNYAKRASYFASEYARLGRGKRMLITCSQEDLERWEYDIRSQFSLLKDPPKIAVLDNGSSEEALSADIVIATRESVENIDISFDQTYDESNLPEYSECKRSHAVHKLISSPEKGGVEYLVMLTGTPLPARISDIGNLASMLEPDNYPNAVTFNEMAAENWNLIRELLIRRMVRRRVEQVMELPELDIDTIPVEMPMKQRLAYHIVQENNFNVDMSTKLAWLRRAAIDPKALASEIDIDKIKAGNPRLEQEQIDELTQLKRLAENAPSGKVDALSEFVKQEVEEGRKVVVFSSVLREGIIQPTVSMLESIGISTTYIDGTVPLGKEREKIKDAFHSEDGPKVLVATLQTMGEGISLTNASTVVFLDYPYTDAEVKQGIARVWRRGQHEKVKVRFLKCLDSIDENAEELVGDRERITRMIIDGVPLTEEEREKYEQRKDKKKKPFGGDVDTPRKKLRRHYHNMHDKGGARNREYISADQWKNGRSFANLYLFRWDTSPGANVGRMLKTLIESIEKKHGGFERIADLASGPASLTRMTGRRTTCVDMNPFFMERAKEDFGELVDVHEGLLDNLPLKDGNHDLAVISLAFHYAPYLPNNGDMSERERIVREALRVLKPGGWLIITEPHLFVSDKGIRLFSEGVTRLGADVQISGFAKDAEDSGFQVFTIAVRKSERQPEELDRPDYFILNTEFDNRDISRRKGKKKEPPEEPEEKKIERFDFEDLNRVRIPLESLFRGPDAAPEDVEQEEPKPRKGKGNGKPSSLTPEEKHEKFIMKKLKELIELENIGGGEDAEELFDKLAELDEKVRKKLASGGNGSPAPFGNGKGAPEPIMKEADAGPLPTTSEEAKPSNGDSGQQPEAAAKKADPPLLPEKAFKKPIAYLLREYGDPKGVKKKCPAEVLDMLGVYVCLEDRGRKKGFVLRKKGNGA